MEQKQTENNLIPIDSSDALERIGGDPSFLEELLNLYFEEFTTKSDELCKAIETKDFKAIQELGHSLKGSSANLSLLALQKTSYEMEMAGREKDIEKAKSTFVLLKDDCERLKEFLAKKMN
ncbi:MAG: Hpt domain-containing protein [Candidatus Aminicenantales bacterium]